MPTRIELDELRGLIESGAQLIEVLPKQEYEDEHLPAAINIPIKMLDETTAARLDRSRPVVVYCYDYI
jgi:rhodanese-related sulfurtransferase